MVDRQRTVHRSRMVGAAVALLAAVGSSATVQADEPAGAPVYEGTVLREAYAPTRYGTEINIDLCFPAVGASDTDPAPGRFPVIALPNYGMRAGQGSCASREFVRRGYVTGTISPPGGAESNGGPAALGSEKTQHSLHDAIEWLGRQSWSTGNVGLMGGSGNGVLVMGVASRRPPSLKAMIPTVTSANGYGSLWPGGMQSLTSNAIACGVVNAAMYANNGGAVPPRDKNDVDRTVEIRSGQVTEQQVPECPLINDYSTRPVYDDWWENDRAKLENIEIPVWPWGGWDDIIAGPTAEIYHQTAVNYPATAGPNNMLSMGFTSHVGNQPGFDQTKEALRFWDRWLKGIDTGIDRNLVDGRFRYLNVNEWTPRVAADYPIPGTEYTPLYLNVGSPHPLASGSATFDEPVGELSATYVYQPDQGIRGGSSGFLRARNEASPANRNDIVAYNEPSGKGDQRLEPSAGRVAFLSDPLEEDLTLTGPMTATMYASTTSADTDFVVKVLDALPEDGEVTTSAPQPGMWRTIVTGYLKGTHRSWKSGYRNPSPIPVGEVVRYEIELYPTGWLLKKGHRIGMSIASADVSYVVANPNPAVVTVHSSRQHPSHVTLPVIPAGASSLDTNSDGVPDDSTCVFKKRKLRC